MTVQVTLRKCKFIDTSEPVEEVVELCGCGRGRVWAVRMMNGELFAHGIASRTRTYDDALRDGAVLELDRHSLVRETHDECGELHGCKI